MVRVDLAALIASRKKFAGSDPESIMISTKRREDGKPVRLELIIPGPPGDGTFPLLAVNHGSTRGGNDPTLFTQTFSNPALAEMFVKKGYMVAFPQGRGRGKSEGLYNEGFAVDRNQGYACDPNRALTDIAAAVEVLLQRPDGPGKRSLSLESHAAGSFRSSTPDCTRARSPA